jgi:hypothetical protein
LEFAHYYMNDDTGTLNNSIADGPRRILGRKPVANASVAFTPEGLSQNYENVSTTPPVPYTDYNLATSAGLTDLFTFGPLDLLTTDIDVVGVTALAQTGDGGSHELETTLKSGTTTVHGTPTLLNGSAYCQQDLFPRDPNGNIAWAVPTVNALTAGYTSVS